MHLDCSIDATETDLIRLSAFHATLAAEKEAGCR